MGTGEAFSPSGPPTPSHGTITSPIFVDLPLGETDGCGRGVKERFYLVVTKSKERAEQFRFIDDASAAYDGQRMSSNKFMANRKDCVMVQNIV